MEIEARTEAELRAALKDGDIPVVVGRISITTNGNESPNIIVRSDSELNVVAYGSSQPHVVARGSSQPHVVAYESSQPHVEAYESSQPHVVAYESSQPHVEAYGSSQPHVVAYGSSKPHVVARESSKPHVVAKGTVQLSIRGSMSVVAAATVAICILGGTPKIKGGGFITRVDISTPAKWCDYYGVVHDQGYALLYKGVRENFNSQRGFNYNPGTTLEAPDWDGGKEECGGGLHFSPYPAMTIEFDNNATRFLACPVRLSEMAVHPDGDYPQKVKARRVALPCYEVDRDGKPINPKDATWPPKKSTKEKKSNG